MQKMKLLTRRDTLAFLAVAYLATLPGGSQADGPAVLVHKDPSCGCCDGWVDHLRKAGFLVTVKETLNLETVRARLQVPSTLASCHTAEISGYVIEGHVPAEAIRHLLNLRPMGLGLAVPGMPSGSPGMEGATSTPYEVILFSREGLKQNFMHFVGEKSVGLLAP